MITVCHHSASHVMPIGDPPDGFLFHPHTHDGFLYNCTKCVRGAIEKFVANDRKNLFDQNILFIFHPSLPNLIIVYISNIFCPLGPWIPLLNFEIIRGSLMIFKCLKLASHDQNTCTLYTFSSFVYSLLTE